MNHYILIRYNINLYSSNPYNVENREEWMQERENLFRWYTLPSLSGQIKHNFKIIVFVDPKTPAIYLENIEYLLLREDLEYSIVKNNVPAFLMRNEWGLYTRLDNDDMLAPTFTMDVQNFVLQHPGEEYLIDFKGIQVDVINNKQYTDGRTRPNSPFCSIVTKDKRIFDYQHTDLPDHFENAVKLDKIGYYQILHYNNIANKPKGEEIL